VDRSVAAVGQQEGARPGRRGPAQRLLDERLEVGEGQRVAAERLDRRLQRRHHVRWQLLETRRELPPVEHALFAGAIHANG